MKILHIGLKYFKAQIRRSVTPVSLSNLTKTVNIALSDICQKHAQFESKGGEEMDNIQFSLFVVYIGVMWWLARPQLPISNKDNILDDTVRIIKSTCEKRKS